MKTKIYNKEGKAGKEIELPKIFSSPIREDIVAKILEARRYFHPYAPNPMSGNSYSASGKLVHRRHVWKSQYGRGMSRIPRKSMSRRGSQFNWVGATVPNTRGGRRAHPPKIFSRLSKLKINKKELSIGLKSALSATANLNFIKKRYSKLKDSKLEHLPIVIDSKILELKFKEIKNTLKKILGKEIFENLEKKKKIRTGIGKLRGRRYKSNASLLIVTGNQEKLKSKNFEVVKVKELNIENLAKGDLGRLTIYTENAIKDLKSKFQGEEK